MKMTCIAGDT